MLTNGDVDAIAGLLHLREGTPLALYAHPAVLEVLDDNPIFDVLDRRSVPRRPLALDAWHALADARRAAPLGLELVPFAVPGKVPLYHEGDGGSP